jgi:hypothetical protein
MKTKQKKAKAKSVAVSPPQEDLIKNAAQLMLVTLVTIQQSISDCMNTINQLLDVKEKKAK